MRGLREPRGFAEQHAEGREDRWTAVLGLRAASTRRGRPSLLQVRRGLDAQRVPDPSYPAGNAQPRGARTLSTFLETEHFTNPGSRAASAQLRDGDYPSPISIRRRPSMSDAERKRRSDAQKGKVPSEETRRKISEANSGEKNANYGVPMSDETKDKISKSNKGKKRTEEQKMRQSIASKQRRHTEETKLKMSNSGKGRRHSEETRKKMSESKKNMSEETKQKISDWHKGKHHSDETKAKMSEDRKGEKAWMWNKNHSEETKKKMSLTKAGKKNKGAKSKYIGVSYYGQTNKWKARIYHYPEGGIHIGYFKTEEDAAKAYNEKAIELFGDEAILNIIEEKEE